MSEKLKNSLPEITPNSTRLGRLVMATKDFADKIRNPESFAKSLLEEAGIKIDGNNPWDPQVKDPNIYRQVVLWWNLALGEAYMDNRWECADLPGFFKRIFRTWLYGRTDGLETLLWYLHSQLINLQTKVRSRMVIDEHYNLWNELYEMFLDELMAYTCWYFPNGNETLDESQEKKVDLVADKLLLQEWMKVADIWCGWWKIMHRIAETRWVEVVWITLSDEQYKYANGNGLHPGVSLRMWDYRETMWEGEFDAIYTIWMTEHIWHKNYPIFTDIVDRSLKEQWKFLWHTIGTNTSTISSDPWMNKYIFKNGLAPSQVQMWKAIEPTKLILEDVHNFWPDYATTLRMWREKFEKNFADLQRDFPQYDDRFYRMWIYYLATMEASFATRWMQLYQNVYSKWVEQKYTWVR